MYNHILCLHQHPGAVSQSMHGLQTNFGVFATVMGQEIDDLHACPLLEDPPVIEHGFR